MRCVVLPAALQNMTTTVWCVDEVKNYALPKLANDTIAMMLVFSCVFNFFLCYKVSKLEDF